MGILDNLENSWDIEESPNLSVKIFSETCCDGCSCKAESDHATEN